MILNHYDDLKYDELYRKEHMFHICLNKLFLVF